MNSAIGVYNTQMKNNIFNHGFNQENTVISNYEGKSINHSHEVHTYNLNDLFTMKVNVNQFKQINANKILFLLFIRKTLLMTMMINIIVIAVILVLPVQIRAVL